MINEEGRKFEIIDCMENKCTYLYPPLHNKILSFIIGNKSLVLLHSDFIVRIELNNEYAISFYEIANINRAFWAKKEETLAVLTYSGLYTSASMISVMRTRKNVLPERKIFSIQHVMFLSILEYL